MKRFRIPDKDIKLSDTEVAVTQTKLFQRLAFMKQLGLAYLVYPSASHTRASHSIRVLDEASKILDVLPGSDQAKAPVRLAALLHDIGHVPFGHTLEDEHPILAKHDRGQRLRVATEMLKMEVSGDTVRKIDEALPILEAVSSDSEDAQDWRSDLVGNTICADLLAYIEEDAMWTGIEKRPGYYRIYEYFEMVQNRLCIRLTKGGLRPDIVSAITDLLDMRYALTERVIFHHGKAVASAMLARAARMAGLTEDQVLLTLGDEGFLGYVDRLGREAQSQGTQSLLAGLRSRRLHLRIFKVGRSRRSSWDQSYGQGDFCNKWRDGVQVEKTLNEVEAAHRLTPGSLALWCPTGEAGMKLSRAKVVWESASTLIGPHELRSGELKDQFPGVWERANTIEGQYRDLWAFWVTLDRKYEDRAAGIVQTLEDAIGVECDPVFSETYLSKLPGFSRAASTARVVRRVTHGLQPDVLDAVLSHSDLKGDDEPDEAAVRAAITEVLEAQGRRADPTLVPKSPDQTEEKGTKSTKPRRRSVPRPRKEPLPFSESITESSESPSGDEPTKPS